MIYHDSTAHKITGSYVLKSLRLAAAGGYMRFFAAARALALGKFVVGTRPSKFVMAWPTAVRKPGKQPESLTHRDPIC